MALPEDYKKDRNFNLATANGISNFSTSPQPVKSPPPILAERSYNTVGSQGVRNYQGPSIFKKPPQALPLGGKSNPAPQDAVAKTPQPTGLAFPYTRADIQANATALPNNRQRLSLGGGSYIDAPNTAVARLGDNRGSVSTFNTDDYISSIRSDTQGKVMEALRSGNISLSEASQLFDQAGQGADYQEPQGGGYNPVYDYIADLYDQSQQGFDTSAPLDMMANQLASRNTARRLLPQFLNYASDQERNASVQAIHGQNSQYRLARDAMQDRITQRNADRANALGRERLDLSKRKASAFKPTDSGLANELGQTIPEDRKNIYNLLGSTDIAPFVKAYMQRYQLESPEQARYELSRLPLSVLQQMYTDANALTYGNNK